MIELPLSVENRLKLAATASGQTVETLIDAWLDEYFEDLHDIQQAELAMQEQGGITLEDLKAKYAL